MGLLQNKKFTPVLFAGVVAAFFGLGVHVFVQAYSGYLRQSKSYDQIKREVRLLTTQKNELILKQRLLKATDQFVKMAASAGLSQDRWTVYDINLQEAVGFEKADQILSQCVSSRVAYFQPLSLQIKIPQKQTHGNKIAEPDLKEDLTLSVQGKFIARQP
jgi:hypothetical protein